MARKKKTETVTAKTEESIYTRAYTVNDIVEAFKMFSNAVTLTETENKVQFIIYPQKIAASDTGINYIFTTDYTSLTFSYKAVSILRHIIADNFIDAQITHSNSRGYSHSYLCTLSIPIRHIAITPSRLDMLTQKNNRFVRWALKQLHINTYEARPVLVIIERNYYYMSGVSVSMYEL